MGDGAASPIMSSIKFFRDEYEAHLDGGCPFDPHASMLAAPEGAGAVTLADTGTATPPVEMVTLTIDDVQVRCPRARW